jgi:hypothetical protein
MYQARAGSHRLFDDPHFVLHAPTCVLIVEASILGPARMTVEHELAPGIDAHLEMGRAAG